MQNDIMPKLTVSDPFWRGLDLNIQMSAVTDILFQIFQGCNQMSKMKKINDIQQLVVLTKVCRGYIKIVELDDYKNKTVE